jgi:hypothetical protein
MTVPAGCPLLKKPNGTTKKRRSFGCLFDVFAVPLVVALAWLFLVLWGRLPW